jgi:hypothetical protein
MFRLDRKAPTALGGQRLYGLLFMKPTKGLSRL